jgi:CheY-like chemotaxis protein
MQSPRAAPAEALQTQPAMQTERRKSPECGEVLIVEDDDAIRRLLAMTFEREGLPVTSARDGMEALEALRRRPFRVVLLDLMMPRVSGWEVIDWLREHPSEKPRTLIVVSATNREVLNELDPMIVNAIVFKPFNVYELTGYVRACCTAPIKVDRRRKRMIGATT